MAANQQYSPLQLYTAPRTGLTGLVEENKLWEAYRVEPDKLQAVIAQAYGLKNGGMGLIEMMTQGKGRVVEKKIKNSRYTWELFTDPERAIECSGLLNPSETPGANGEYFYLTFPERVFELGANLRADNGQIARVMEDSYQQGLQYVYAMQMNDKSSYMEPSVVAAGARFTEVWANYAEGSVRGTGVQTSTPAKLYNQIGTFRKTGSVTRNGAKVKQFMPIVSKGENGEIKKSLVWAEDVVWQTIAEQKKALAYAGIYGKLSSHQLDANGRPIFMGAGIREQLHANNRREFIGEITFEDFSDLADSLYQNVVDNGGTPEIIVLTGTDGLRMVEEVIEKKLVQRFGSSLHLDSNHFVSKDADGLKTGGYFRTVELPSGVTLKFRNFPLYNDRTHNRLINPKTGNPWESSRFTFLNFGLNSNGEPNIQKVIPEDMGSAMWTVGGSMDGKTTRKNLASQGASGFDGYDFHLIDDCGYVITDPTTCAELVPAGLRDF
jgi:hypothetical protein